MSNRGLQVYNTGRAEDSTDRACFHVVISLLLAYFPLYLPLLKCEIWPYKNTKIELRKQSQLATDEVTNYLQTRVLTEQNIYLVEVTNSVSKTTSTGAASVRNSSVCSAACVMSFSAAACTASFCETNCIFSSENVDGRLIGLRYSFQTNLKLTRLIV